MTEARCIRECICLETFLGGMETLADPLLVGGGKALETFLGGMETSIGSSGIVPPATLKPSLVEWKLGE